MARARLAAFRLCEDQCGNGCCVSLLLRSDCSRDSRNWIGRSQGAEIDFKIENVEQQIRVFTTRPDTLYGGTFLVLAPEHSLVDLIVTEEQWPAVREYRERAARKSELERVDLSKEKTGVFTGAYAINPATKKKITAWLEERGLGKRAINYKLRDWLFSRQRYWGEPFPIVWENGKHRALEESELPVVPPPLEDYKPTGSGDQPLAKAKDWVRYSEKATRETNVMPQWAGSCWYYLRFCDPHDDRRFGGEQAERYWMGGEKPGG